MTTKVKYGKAVKAKAVGEIAVEVVTQRRLRHQPEYEELGDTVTISVSTPDITNKEFHQKLNEISKKQKPAKTTSGAPSMYEASFLNDMINGRYEGFSVDKFEDKKDQRLFAKFNAMSKTAQKKKFDQLMLSLKGYKVKP